MNLFLIGIKISRSLLTWKSYKVEKCLLGEKQNPKNYKDMKHANRGTFSYESKINAQ